MRLLSESASVEIGQLINNIFSSERFIWQLDHETEFLIGSLETKLCIMLLMAGSSPRKPQLTISVSMSPNAAKNAVLLNRFKILKLIEGHAGQF